MPRLFRLLLWLRPSGHRRDEIAADLDELFVTRAAMVGPREARRRYRRDVLSLWFRRRPHRGGPTGPPGPAPRVRWRSGIVDDLRYGTRVFRRQPALVLLALAGLAIAMGVATAAVSFVHAALLRPVAVPDPDSVVSLVRVVGRSRIELGGMTLPEFRAIDEAATTVRAEAAYRTSARVTDSLAALAEHPLRTTFVTSSFFETFGARPAAGRLLGEQDAGPGSTPTAVLMHGRWLATFGGDPAVVGRTIHLNGAPVTIVGVVESGFGGPFKTEDLADLFLHAAAVSQFEDAASLGRRDGAAALTYEVSGRLVGGATVVEANAEMQVIGASIGLRPDDPQRPEGLIARSAGKPIDGDVLGVLSVVVAIVGLVVLLAAGNVANLLMAGTTTRGREIAARLALGASPRRILRQLLTESLLVGAVAGASGVVAAAWLTTAAARVLGASPNLDLSIDPWVIGLIGVVSLAVGLTTGLGPARHALRSDVTAMLKGTSPAATIDGLGRLRAFVAVQAGASLLLLVLTALFARALVEASSIGLPFDPEQLVEVEAPSYGGASALPADVYWQLAVDRAIDVPGVDAVSLVQRGPFGGVDQNPTILPGLPNFPVLVPRVDHRFFETTRLRVLSGRTFTADEVAVRAPVVVVSEKYARAFWPGRNPVGQNPSHVVDDMPDATVIGVVEDVPWTINPPRYFGAAALFEPLREIAAARMIVRTSDATIAMPALRSALEPVDPGRRTRVVRISDRLAGHLRIHSNLAAIAGGVGALALSLAFIGLFGVTAFVVALRRREIGIRLAIGAGRGDVLALVFRQGMRPVALGLAAGLAVSLVGAQVFVGFLAGGVGPRDPIALASAVTVLIAAAGVGVLVPARLVLRIEPTEVLRES